LNERASSGERTTRGERAITGERTKMAERAINSERTKGEERTWFDVWQARRIASRANLRQFQLLTIAKRLSHAHRENQKRRASQQPRVNHSEGASQ